MKYICEFASHYNIGDIVLIEYWYNDIIVPVIIKEKVGRKYKVSHNIEQSKIKNAPDEIVSSMDIIDKYKSMVKKSTK